MQGTLKLLKQLTTEETQKMTLEDMASKYRVDLNPQYLAAAFVKLFALIIGESQSFFGLSSEDVASFAVEKLDSCLQKYDGQAKFITYFTTVIRNKFRQETQALSMQKRKAIFNTCSIEEKEPAYEDQFDDIKYSLPGNLSSREREYCEHLSQGLPTSHIADLMRLSTTTLYKYKHRLRIKLSAMNV